MHIDIRRAESADVEAIASINAAVFLGDKDRPESAREWITCWHRAFPLYQYFVATVDDVVVGYSGWQVHGGFSRAEPVVELDQVGVDPAFSGHGIASRLIHEAMLEIVRWMRSKNDRIESHISFVVWVYSTNFNAISVYVKDFSDSIQGFRHQFGDRAESMLRRRMPLVMPVRGG